MITNLKKRIRNINHSVKIILCYVFSRNHKLFYFYNKQAFHIT